MYGELEERVEESSRGKFAQKAIMALTLRDRGQVQRERNVIYQ